MIDDESQKLEATKTTKKKREEKLDRIDLKTTT